MQITSKPITNVTEHWLPQLPSLQVSELRALYHDTIDYGPRTLVLAIEGEFSRRGLDPMTLRSVRK